MLDATPATSIQWSVVPVIVREDIRGNELPIRVRLPVPTPSDPQIKLGTIIGPRPTPAAWLGDIERRIRNSAVPCGQELDNDGKWLSWSAINSAISYFREVSDLLPVEPYLYSPDGKALVAEFRVPEAPFMAIISGNAVQIIATYEGGLAAGPPIPCTAGADVLRSEIKKQLEGLSKGQHGRKVGA